MHLWMGAILIGLASVLAQAQDTQEEGTAQEQTADSEPSTLDSSTAKTIKDKPTNAAEPVSPADTETHDIDDALERGINKPKDAKDEEVEIKQLPEVKDVSGLARLSQFEDIAVIQRRYLPKTMRFELFPNLGFIINDAFFTNAVASGRVGFHFSESMGVELNLMILGTSERAITKDLARLGVTTRSLVTPQSYYGADFKWSPVYGKMGLFNSSVVPFDLYFSVGAGQTKTNQGQNSMTLHLGTGQIYALAKWAAFRWDLSWYWYKADATTGGSGSFTNIYAMLGVSFFIPEAKYR